jgi:AP-1 complex subunit mu
MRAHFKLPSIRSEEQQAKPPIEVKFEIPFFTVSGINVRFPSLSLAFSHIVLL